MNKKVLITGSNGTLGTELKYELDKNLITFFTNKKNFNILNFNQMEKFCKKNRPDFVINTAALTNTILAEENNKLAYDLNYLSVKYLLKLSKKYNFKIIHFSTDYVFDGKKNKKYKETHKPKPINYYGYSKNLADSILMQKNNKNNNLILRVSLLYSLFGKNILTQIIKQIFSNEKMFYVNDIICSPTSAKNIAKFCNFLILNNIKLRGIYNFADDGFCSRFEFAQYIARKLNPEKKINRIISKNLNQLILRPKSSILDNTKLKNKTNFKTNSWKYNLKILLKNLDSKTN